MTNKPTVTVGIPAYNEEKGIRASLESVLKQKEEGFTLKEIIVIADAPTDKTVEIVKNIDSDKIRLISNKERAGQLARINDIYKLFDSDILLQTDADIVFGNDEVISEIVKIFKSDNKIMMVGGYAVPETPKSFIEKSIYTTVNTYNNVALNISKGNNIHTVHGCAVAFRTEFVKNVTVPLDAVVNDVYMYYLCLSKGYKYAFSRKSEIYYKLPTDLKNHIKQSIRYYSTSNTVDKYFPKELVEKECYIPKTLLLQYMFKEFIMHPIKCLFIFAVNKYCDYKASNITEVKPTWELDTSARK